MTDDEYSMAIRGILASGRGYKAITDLIESLNIMNENMQTVIREMNSERRAIKKICEGPTSFKNKVQTILQIM